MGEHHPFVVLVMGVSGAGKTTVGEALAARLGWTFVDADALHPPENVAKMAAGIPLEDADRWPWLAKVASRIERSFEREEPLVLACSALKAGYRALLHADDPRVLLVLLEGDPVLIAERMKARTHHFMPPALLASQLQTLEPPKRALRLDVAHPPEALVESIVEALGRAQDC